MSADEYRSVCKDLAGLYVEVAQLRAAELDARRMAWDSSPATSNSARELDAKYAGATHQIELLKLEGDIRAHELTLRYLDFQQRERTTT